MIRLDLPPLDLPRSVQPLLAIAGHKLPLSEDWLTVLTVILTPLSPRLLSIQVTRLTGDLA